MQIRQVLIGLFVGILLTGCATSPDNPDPYENINRKIFAFNKDVDNAILKPIAETYKTVTPEAIDRGVTNFFSNLNDVVVVINDLLQFKFKQAASDTGRFLVNTTVGVLGFADIATEFGLEKHYEDFGQTLGHWGVQSGPYIMLPFFGPSSGRDFVGRGVDLLFDPRLYIQTDASTRNFVLATNVLEAVDMRADLLGVEDVVETAAVDEYSYIRDAYLQRREFLVYDGDPPEEPLSEDLENLLFEE